MEIRIFRFITYQINVILFYFISLFFLFFRANESEVRLGLMAAVKFIFTNVDPRDPDRVFSFSIRLHKSTGSWTSK